MRALTLDEVIAEWAFRRWDLVQEGCRSLRVCPCHTVPPKYPSHLVSCLALVE